MNRLTARRRSWAYVFVSSLLLAAGASVFASPASALVHESTEFVYDYGSPENNKLTDADEAGRGTPDLGTSGNLRRAGSLISVAKNSKPIAPRALDDLVEGAGSGTRTINFRPNAADPNWGLTQTHLDKHLFGSGPHSLSTIDSAGNPALWTDYIQDLAGRRVTSTTSNGMQDIIGSFPLADGSGTFQFGIRLSPNTDGTFDLITLLTRQ